MLMILIKGENAIFSKDMGINDITETVNKRLMELSNNGQCEIIELGLFGQINTHKQARSKGKMGMPKDYRKGNIVFFAGKQCDILTAQEKLIYLDTEVFFSCRLWQYTWRLDSNGYAVGGANIYMHRLICALEYGEIKDLEIDHIDGMRNNNCIYNLRPVSHEENQQNKNQEYMIGFNRITGEYEYKNFLVEPIDFKLFNIPFNGVFPKPTNDLYEMKKSVSIYKKEFSKSMGILLANKDYKRYLKGIQERMKTQTKV